MRAAGMKRVEGVNKLFIERDRKNITLVVAKVIEYFIMAGRIADIEGFIEDLRREFEICNTAIGGSFRFNGCEIDVSAEAIKVSMC